MALSMMNFVQQATVWAGTTRFGYWLQAQPAVQVSPRWGLWVILLIVGIVILWWLLQGEAQERSTRSNVVVVTPPNAPNAPVRITVVSAASGKAADDLTKVEGVAPKRS